MKKFLPIFFIILMLETFSTAYADQIQIPNDPTSSDQNFVQIVDIDPEKFLRYVRELSDDESLQFSDLKNFPEAYDTNATYLTELVSIYGVGKIEGCLIFFVNDSNFVSAVGISKYFPDSVSFEKILDIILECTGLNEFEKSQLKNSKDELKSVYSLRMNRRIFLTMRGDSILIFATDK